MTLVKNMRDLRSSKLLYSAQGTSDFSLFVLFHRFIIYCIFLPFFGYLILSDHVVQKIHFSLPFDIRIHFSLADIFFQKLLIEHMDPIVLLNFLLGEVWTRAITVDTIFFIQVERVIVDLVQSIASVVE